MVAIVTASVEQGKQEVMFMQHPP